MAHRSRYPAANHPKIAAIEETSDTLTSRAGLALFARYLDKIGIAWFAERWLGPIRKNRKGSSAFECLRQILLFLVDGTSRHLTHFEGIVKTKALSPGNRPPTTNPTPPFYQIPPPNSTISSHKTASNCR